jgi:hypothetical protein
MASTSLATSSRFFELDATAWSNNTVRVLARNVSNTTFARASHPVGSGDEAGSSKQVTLQVTRTSSVRAHPAARVAIRAQAVMIISPARNERQSRYSMPNHKATRCSPLSSKSRP